MLKNYVIFFHILLPLTIWGQSIDWQNPNFHEIEVENQSIVDLGKFPIIVESIMIKNANGVMIPRDQYTYTSQNNRIQFSSPITAKIEFYTYPESLTQTVSVRDSNLIVERPSEQGLYDISEGINIPKNQPFENLNTQGSLVRGISFGNNQNASVQSSLNLTMDGKLSDNLNIKANLADYNIPIEQNGFTQQINEFENIFLSVYNQNSSLNAGFIEIDQKNTYFANFYKKLTGVQLNTKLNHSASYTDVSITGSISRGEFNRIRFKGIEGNQGPYKLSGKNNEVYIIIIPNSEKVYLDGIILEKGLEKDYVVNYNTGELNFTSKILISQNHRITVEFQYTALSYNRFLVYGKVDHHSEKWRIQSTIYSESDAKNSPRNDDLDNADKERLAQAGNNPSLMFAPTAKEAEYDDNKILYRKVNSGGMEIYEYSTDPLETLYTVRFTYVGENKGNYIKEENSVNGRIFNYIPPVGGQPQGSYAPLEQLVAPESRQVYTLDSEYRFKKGGIALNMALSENDRNTFSSIDDNENQGYAIRTRLYKNFKWKEWNLNPSVEYSFIQQNFFIIDRINKIEFNRDFNLDNEFAQIDQNQLNFKLNLQKKSFYLDYSLDFLKRKENYKGNTQFIDWIYQPKKTLMSANVLLHSDTAEESKTDLQEYKIKAQRSVSKNTFTIGTEGRMLNSESQNEAQVHRQNNQKYYLQNTYSDSLKLSYTSELYFSKNDTLRIGSDLKNNTIGGIFNTEWKIDANNGINLGMHIREIDTQDQLLDMGFKESNLLSQLEIRKSVLSNSIQLSSRYELGNGNEPQREFQYVEVSDGNGIYKWTDYNENGIQEIEEFELAEFQDLAKYIRVYTSSVSYIKTAKNALNFSMNFNPYSKWNTDFAKRWKIRANYQNQSSFLKEKHLAAFNPFEEKNLRFRNESVLANLIFNSISRNAYEVYYNFFLNSNYRNNYLGEESLEKRTHQFSVKNRVGKKFILENLYLNSHTLSKAQNLLSRNYEIQSSEYNPSLSYNYLQSFKLKGYYHFKNKENHRGEERLKVHNLGIETEYFKKKSSLIASFNWVQNQFEGDAFSVVGNQMMEGLKVGENWVWNISLQQELANFLFINFVYEGRKSPENKAIHIGNAQVKFVF